MELIVGNPIVERVGQRYAQISSDWVLPSTTRHMPSQSESSTYAVIGFMDADDNNKMGNASNFELVLNVAVDAVWRLRTCVTSDDFAAGISFTQRKTVQIPVLFPHQKLEIVQIQYENIDYKHRFGITSGFCIKRNPNIQTKQFKVNTLEKNNSNSGSSCVPVANPSWAQLQ